MLLICGLFFLIEIDQIEFDIFGVALAMLAAASYATYIIFSKRSINLLPLTYAFAVSIGSAIICFIISSSPDTWFYIIAMSAFCMSCPYCFYLKVFKSTPAERAVILSVLEPVFVVIGGVMLLGDKLSIFQGLGAWLLHEKY